MVCIYIYQYLLYLTMVYEPTYNLGGTTLYHRTFYQLMTDEFPMMLAYVAYLPIILGQTQISYHVGSHHRSWLGTKPSSINPSTIGVSENGKNHVISPNARCTEFLPTCFPQTWPSFVGKYTSTMEHMVEHMGITSLPPQKKPGNLLHSYWTWP